MLNSEITKSIYMVCRLMLFPEAPVDQIAY